MNQKTHTGTDGFSLIETLVALFVIAMISTAAGSMLLDTLRASSRVDASAEAIRRIEVANGLIRADLAAMTRRASTGPDSYLPAVGPTGNDGRRDGLVLAFVRGGWSDFASEEVLRSDLMRIEYRREEGKLIRRAYTAPDPATRTLMVERVLFDDLTDLRLRYHADGSWSNEWVTPADREAPLLPDLIEMTVTFQDGRTLGQKMLAGGGLS